MRTLPATLVLSLLLLAGCGGPPGGQGRTAPPPKQLTADQQEEWEKYRRLQKQPGYAVAGYLVADKTWVAHSHGRWVAPARRREHVTAGDASRVAFTCAKEPGVKAAVVLEMYGGASPAAVDWWYNDGSGVKAVDASPFPELEGALADFIRECQTVPTAP